MAATSDEHGSADNAEAPGQGADAREQEPAGANDDADPPPGAVAMPGQKQSGRIRRWARSARRLPAFFKLLAAISAAALTALLVLAVIATAQAVFDDGYDDGWFDYSTNTGPNGRDLIIEGVHHNGPGGPDDVYDRFDAGFGRHCDDHGFGDACGRQRGLKHRGPQRQCGFRGWAFSDGKRDAVAKQYPGVPGRCGGGSDWGSLDDLYGSSSGQSGFEPAPRWWSGGPGFSEWFEPWPRGWSGPFGNGGPALEFSGDAAPFGLFGTADPFTDPSGALGLLPGIGPQELSDLRASCEQFRTLLGGRDGDGVGDESPQIGVNELLLGVLCPWPETVSADDSADDDGESGDSDDDVRDDEDADDPTAADPGDA